MLPKVGVSLLLCAAGMVCGIAQSTSSPSETVFPRFKLLDVQRDCEAPSRAAKLCTLGSQGTCFTMPSETRERVRYDFGNDPATERLPLAGGGSWVFFAASFSACGSGTLERVAVLRYEAVDGGRIVDLMPYVAVSNVSDRAMWSVPEASPYPLYVQADFEWKETESHFGEHFFGVEVWRFDPAKSMFERALRYRTAKRYGGGDGGHVRVLVPERTEILRRLGAE